MIASTEKWPVPAEENFRHSHFLAHLPSSIVTDYTFCKYVPFGLYLARPPIVQPINIEMILLAIENTEKLLAG